MQTTKGMQETQGRVSGGFKRLGEKLFGKKLTPEEQLVQGQVQLDESRTRSNNMAASLLAIGFNSPENTLPQEIIQAEGYRDVTQYLAKQLQDAQILQLNTEGIDQSIAYAINAFAEAILRGKANTAHWACNALSNEILMLRQDIPASDAAWAEEVGKAREDYISTYEVIIESCKQMDDNLIALERQRSREKEKREEYNSKLADYNAYRVTEQGMAAQIELERCADTPGQMSEAAKELRSMLNDLAILKAQRQELVVGVDTLENANKTHAANIEVARNKLTIPPNAYDPHLLDKIDTIDEKYRDRLRKSLQDINEFRKSLQRHNEEIKSIMNSETFRNLTADAQTEMMNLEAGERNKLENETRAKMRLQQRQAELQRQKAQQEQQEENNDLEEANDVWEMD